jgi:hypothetical protein
VVTLLLALFSIGIGVGCMLCERLSGGVVELGLVPFGAFGLTVFALDLAWATSVAAGAPNTHDVGTFLTSGVHWHVAIALMLIGVFGGFFIVPLLAFVQHRADPRHLSRIIAANNVCQRRVHGDGGGRRHRTPEVRPLDPASSSS